MTSSANVKKICPVPNGTTNKMFADRRTVRQKDGKTLNIPAHGYSFAGVHPVEQIITERKLAIKKILF